MKDRELEVIVSCDGEEVFNGNIGGWFNANNDDKEYLEEICEPLINHTQISVSFCEISGDWQVKLSQI